jgi:hypothetical protein
MELDVVEAVGVYTIQTAQHGPLGLRARLSVLAAPAYELTKRGSRDLF